ncbi:MAG: hypothetical protein M1816_006352 [Peltula sp. TS41687]|nr:MAG: hypothetical protein M1816_006352 [Peltula sp. TS41687]
MSRDQITCHVLDTTTGRPAAGIYVILSHILGHKQVVFNARTDPNGRIESWNHAPGSPSLRSTLEAEIHGGGDPRSIWSLKFNTLEYFGSGNTFFPEVEVRFFVNMSTLDHYHVPLLLSPWSYTTYRGS